MRLLRHRSRNHADTGAQFSGYLQDSLTLSLGGLYGLLDLQQNPKPAKLLPLAPGACFWHLVVAGNTP